MRKWSDLRFGLILAFTVAVCASPMAAGTDRRVADAAKRDDLKAVEEAIRQNADVNAAQPDGATAMHWAAHYGDLPIVEALIKAGANVNVTEEGGVTPLALAAMNGDAAMAGRLIRAGAQPNLGRETAVLVAARTGAVPVIQLLLDAGGDPNAKEPLRGQTALMWAAAEKHPAAVKLLVAKGADVNAKTEGKDAPQGGTMRQVASPPPGDGNGNSSGNTNGAGRPNAAGMRAVRNGPAANGANGYSAVLFAARAGDLETVRTLLDAGANVNDSGRDGLSPLLVAAHRGYAKLAMFLLDRGASAKYDGAGYTALHWAAGSWETELTVTSISPDREDEEWRTVAGLREGRLELIKALIAHGADVNARITRTPQRVGSSKNPGLPELEGATPFVVASVAGDVEVMRELVAHGADAHLKTKQNATALMAAAGMGRVIGEVAVPEARTLDAAKYLFELGDPEINAVDELGNSALHYAAFMRRDGIVQLLADKGARLDGRNKWGETPLFLAEVVFQFAGGGRYESGPTSTGSLLRKLGAEPSKPDYTLRPLYWPNIPHV